MNPEGGVEEALGLVERAQGYSVICHHCMDWLFQVLISMDIVILDASIRMFFLMHICKLHKLSTEKRGLIDVSLLSCLIKWTHKITVIRFITCGKVACLRVHGAGLYIRKLTWHTGRITEFFSSISQAIYYDAFSQTIREIYLFC